MRSCTVLAALGLMLGIGGLASGQPASGPQSRPGWEYKEMPRPDIEKLAGKDDKERFVAGLNRLGAEGWELVAVEAPAHGKPAVYLFKRPAGIKKAEPKAEAKPLPAHILRLKNARATELAKTLTAVFKKADGLNVVPDERSNALILLGSEEQVFEAARVIAELDQEVAETGAGKGK